MSFTNIFAHHQGGSNETGVIRLKLSEVFRGKTGGNHYHRTAANFIKIHLPGGIMLLTLLKPVYQEE